MTDTRTELIEWLKRRRPQGLTAKLGSGSPIAKAIGDKEHERLDRFIAYVESAAALADENERLRKERDNVCFMIRRMHRKFKVGTLDSAFIVQMVQMAYRYCPPNILRDDEAARRAAGGKDES